jgi:alkaline phosphatase D
LKNCAPFAGLQFFGQVDIDRRMARMTVSLKDIEGTTLFEQKLAPSRGRQDE